MREQIGESAMEGSRRLSSNVIAAVLSVVVNSLILFELYRFIVAQIGPANLGVWSLVMAVAAAARLGEGGLGGGVIKFVSHDLGAELPDRAAGTVLMAATMLGTLMLLICVGLWPVITRLLGSVLPDAKTLSIGKQLLPWALTALWLSALSNIFVGALDAARRTGLRAAAIMASGTIQLLCAYFLIPKYGLLALGPVQVVAAGTTLLITMVATILVFKQPPRAWCRWSKRRMKELVSYGGAYQLAAISQLAFEPCVKWLLGSFGTLTLAGYFELANRAVSQMRLVIAAAYQMLVPHVSTRIGRDGLNSDSINATYRDSARLLLLISLPYFALIGCALPLFFTFWIGEYSSSFILIGLFCLVGWALNTLAIPAFVLFLSVGKLRWNVLSQVTVGILNLIFASIGGLLYGGVGVVAGAMVALSMGTLVATFAFHREFNISFREFATKRLAITAFLSLTAVVASVWISIYWHGVGRPPKALLIPVVLYTVLTISVLWRDRWLMSMVRTLIPKFGLPSKKT